MILYSDGNKFTWLVNIFVFITQTYFYIRQIIIYSTKPVLHLYTYYTLFQTNKIGDKILRIVSEVSEERKSNPRDCVSFKFKL